MASKGLYANINARKKAGTSRPKSESTVSSKSYKNMQAGFPKKKEGGKVFKSHMMYDKKTGKAVKAPTKAKHLELKDKGYGHTKPKKMKEGGMLERLMKKRERALKESISGVSKPSRKKPLKRGRLMKERERVLKDRGPSKKFKERERVLKDREPSKKFKERERVLKDRGPSKKFKEGGLVDRQYLKGK
jgi:hypothetical protein